MSHDNRYDRANPRYSSEQPRGGLLGAFTGLGFQVFENFQYMTNAVLNNFGASPVQDVSTVFVLKGIRHRDGRGAARHARHILDAETELAARIAATDEPGGRDAQDARAELTPIRALATSMTSGRVGA